MVCIKTKSKGLLKFVYKSNVFSEGRQFAEIYRFAVLALFSPNLVAPPIIPTPAAVQRFRMTRHGVTIPSLEIFKKPKNHFFNLCGRESPSLQVTYDQDSSVVCKKENKELVVLPGSIFFLEKKLVKSAYLAKDDFRSEVLRRAAESPCPPLDPLREAKVGYLQSHEITECHNYCNHQLMCFFALTHL